MKDHAPRASDSAVERALVARGWADIDAAERMGAGATRRHRVATLGADHARASAWFRPPDAEHVPASMQAMYESEANVVRYRRVVDFLSEGDRVYEVGLGYGYLAALMMREGRLGRYHGVDLLPDFVHRTDETLRRNGLEDVGEVETKNLYDVTRADLEAIGANLLVCCEVVEHVPDPGLALRTLAGALPEGTDLLFSVPLVGRLETVWGHGQVFGAARIQELLGRAGLVAHHVEVLHDTWALVLASTAAAPSPRAASALEGIAPIAPERFLAPAFHAMDNIPVTSLPRAESRWTKRVGDLVVAPVAKDPDAEVPVMEALRVSARAERITRGPGRGWSASAGIAFAVPEGTKGVRLEMHVPVKEDIAALHLEFRRDGERIGLWKWRPAEGRMNAEVPTFLIAPGRGGVHMRRVPGARSEGADTVEVYAFAREDQPIDFRIRRWAWVS